jgi:hypothetical protein
LNIQNLLVGEKEFHKNYKLNQDVLSSCFVIVYVGEIPGLALHAEDTRRISAADRGRKHIQVSLSHNCSGNSNRGEKIHKEKIHNKKQRRSDLLREYQRIRERRDLTS